MANDVEYRVRQDRLRLAQGGKAKRINHVANLHRRVLLREHPQSFGATLQKHHISSLLISNHPVYPYFVTDSPVR